MADTTEIPLPIDLSLFARRQKRGAIRDVCAKCAEINGLSLANGSPPYSVFPVHQIAAKGPHGLSTGFIELADEALNYGSVAATGLVSLREWAREFVVSRHNPPYSGFDVCITSGTTDLLWKIQVLASEPRDAVLCDEYTYPGITVAAHQFERALVGVGGDSGGMTSEALREKCSLLQRSGVRPKILYMMGVSNPTSVCMSLERKRELYRVAQEFNLLILEDDAYCHVTLGAPNCSHTLESMEGLTGTIDSFLSIDHEGRVVRMDSFSKTLAPALRVGFATMHTTLLHKFAVTCELTSWAISGPTQALVSSVLTQWGEEGYDAHLRRLQLQYTVARDHLVAAIEKHMQGLVTYTVPLHAMFVWLRINGVRNTDHLIDGFLAEKVMVVPGSGFSFDNSGSPYIRMCFTQCTPEMAEEACMRISKAIRRYLAAPSPPTPAVPSPIHTPIHPRGDVRELSPLWRTCGVVCGGGLLFLAGLLVGRKWGIVMKR